uniref:Peptidase M12B domain-containing protein n=1 Tax=Clastoptera arizonana TaxID=38151 RepID=A0A1B6E0Y8_9HEMI
MVVADKKMVEYHGSNLNFYVLSLMSSVAQIYKDATIGNPVSITVVKLYQLMDIDLARKKKYEEGIAALHLLHEFCKWQQKHNDKDDNSANHHDCALLLTRENICRDPSTQKCDTLGLAELGTMCDESSSCAIVQDNGLSAAFTIAHELGHVLNMPHDDDIKCNPYRGTTKMHVMSRMLDEHTYPWSWSNCSRHYLTEFLDAGYGRCLLDQPKKDILSLQANNQLPGEDFDENRQCQLIYGRDSKMCSFMPVRCRELWCTREKGELEGCRTQHMPWADGTPCEKYHWCQRGECVRRDKVALQKIDGGWGEWQGFEDCSRTCGGGVKRAFRECNNPTPSNGGRYCVGRRVRYRSCSTKDCPPGTPDFREEQCSAFNNNNFSIQGLSDAVRWVPKYDGIGTDDRCKLYCRVTQSSSYYLLKEKVIDGTVCGPDTFDICVNGICRQAGCNHYLNSNSQLDYCGVCGGDNSSCQLITGTYNIAQYGYTRVVKVPAGSSNLDVRQNAYKGSVNISNFLALRDGETGEYVLNGNYIVSPFRKLILYGGITLEYNGADAIVERINSSRPLGKDLIVEIFSVENMHPPDVVYQYTVQKTQFMWELSDDWSSCDKICNGYKQRILRCTRVTDRQEVSSQLCVAVKPIESPSQPCNRDCILKWQVIGQSECSSHCGTGTRTLSIQCVRQSFDSQGIFVVSNSSCNHLSVPSTTEACVGPCDKTRWRFSEWSMCSKTCGSGIQRRAAECVDEDGNTLSIEDCNKNELITNRICATQKCPVWVVGQWTPCSVTCGSGVRIRAYWCELDNVKILDGCAKEEEPHYTEACNLEKCATWIVGDWSPCSVTCGDGLTSRSVTCSAEGQCSSITKPPTTESCKLHPCSLQHKNSIPDTNSINHHYSYTWKTEEWSSCSVTCGEGMKRRMIVCYDEVNGKPTDSRSCLHLQKPTLDSVCMERSCVSWRVGSWGQCSATCGQGVETRVVACTADGVDIDERECNGVKPDAERACFTQCENSIEYKWRTGQWGSCSEECGGGMSNRLVVCQSVGGPETMLPESHCRADRKPVSSVTCNQHPCQTEWIFGAWSPCNQTCGGGYQHRQVLCQNKKGVRFPDESCTMSKRPPSMQECYIKHCEESAVYRWKTHSWGQCSTTCGLGVQHRSVVCHRVNKFGHVDPEPVPSSSCDAKIMPESKKSCQLSPCYAQYSWVPGPWQSCTHPCGKKGRQRRRLFCYQNKDNKKVNRRYCPKELKPQNKRKCNQKRCGFASCLEIQQKHRIRIDREYTLSVAGRNLSIYCHNMATSNPVEFLTLPTGETENYSEAYGLRLYNPDSCPYNGQRRENCHCIKDHERKAGLTLFSKIRLNVTSLRVYTNDFTFSHQALGRRINYGEAGDCYSRMNCPQGRFSINLSGTGLRVAPYTQWRGHGAHASLEINKLEENRKVIGRCGGYCGTCSPQNGLKLDVLPP